MSDQQTRPPSEDVRDSREDPPLVKKRSASQWLVLLVVWGAGLAVWAIYLVAALYLFFKLFA